MTQGTGHKIVIVGASGVGKTSILQRLIDDSFQADAPTTVGVEFKPYLIPIDGGDPVRLNIWDTAGQERFRSVSKAYFRNAVGAILVFALNDSVSFGQLDQWLADLRHLASPNAVILLVGNKADEVDDRQVTEQQGIEFGKRHSLAYSETSARLGDGVREVFVRLTNTILEKVRAGDLQEVVPMQVAPPVSRPANPVKPRGCAC
jgi:small GTP-binding protein